MVGQYGVIFHSRPRYRPSLRSGQYGQSRKKYFPVLPSQSCNIIMYCIVLYCIILSITLHHIYYELLEVPKNYYFRVKEKSENGRSAVFVISGAMGLLVSTCINCR